MVEVTLKCFDCLYEEEREREKNEDYSGLACPNCSDGSLTELEGDGEDAEEEE